MDASETSFEDSSYRDTSVMSSIMFPKEFDQMVKFRQKYGPVELLPTDVFFAGPEHHRELEVGGSSCIIGAPKMLNKV